MKMYEELANWWPLVSAPEEYAEEADLYASAIVAASDGTCRTVLELGSGGGNNASHLKQRFDLTLVEPSEGLVPGGPRPYRLASSSTRCSCTTPSAT